jgi:predicted AAA+ superfamily ATPase
MINRPLELEALDRLLRRFPVVGIVGARQVGKTTLARAFADRTGKKVVYYDLENPEDLARLTDPMLRQSSETLAGRIAYRQLNGFSLAEVGGGEHLRLWLRGSFPRSYLAPSLEASCEWRREFIRTFLEKDLLQLGINIRSATLQRFWSMLAHYHGQIWNASEFARSLGVSDNTVRNYKGLSLSRLSATSRRGPKNAIFGLLTPGWNLTFSLFGGAGESDSKSNGRFHPRSPFQSVRH